MKRSRAFVHAVIKNHRERMLATFARARKHTNQFLKDNHQSAKDEIFSHGNNFLEKGIRIVKKIYFNVVVQIGCLFIRSEYTRRDFIAFFVVALFLGMGIKSLAIQTITIGFEDYKLAPKETLYDMNLVQQKVIGQGNVSLENNPRKGGVCSEPSH